MATKISIKRTSVAGRTPNTSILDTGELALNITDRKLFSSNGSFIFEVGANLSSLSVSGNTSSGNLSVTGEITATGDITAFFSDERLKDRYDNISNPLDKVKTLNGFYYEPNEIAQSLGYEKKMYIGLSAQEVQAILPEVIKPAPVDNKYLTVDYAKLVPLLVEAIKEQQEHIERLESKIDLLGK
jgi:hypothetical protein